MANGQTTLSKEETEKLFESMGGTTSPLLSQEDTLKLFNSMEEEDNMPSLESFNPKMRQRWFVKQQDWAESVPAMFRTAYNQSIGGMLDEITNGEKFYKIDEDIPRGMAFDMMSGFLSFFASKEDLAIMAGTFGTGTVAKMGAQKLATPQIKGALQWAAKKGLFGEGVKVTTKKGGEIALKSPMGQEMFKQTLKDIAEVGIQQGAMLSGHHGMYTSTKQIRDDMIRHNETFPEHLLRMNEEGNYEELYESALEMVWKESKWQDYGRGYALAFAGAPGRTFGRAKGFLGTGVGKKTFEAGLVTEAGVVGATMAPILEGRLASPSETMTNMMIAMGMVAAIQTPVSAVKAIRKGWKTEKQGKYEPEMSEDELTRVVKKSADDDRYIGRSQAIYKQVEQPIAAIRDAQGLKPGQGQLSYNKKGQPIITGLKASESEKSIKHLNKRYLPENVPSGVYANTVIFGKRVGTKIKKRKQGGVGETETLWTHLGLEEIPMVGEARILYDTIKYNSKKEGVQFSIQMGRTVYDLDPKNADLFIKFWTNNKKHQAEFLKLNKAALSKKVKAKLGDKQKYYKNITLEEQYLRDLRSDASLNKNHLIKSDWSDAVNTTANMLKHRKWQKLIKDGKLDEIKISEMSSAEIKFLRENLADIQFYRNFDSILTDVFAPSYKKQYPGPGSAANESWFVQDMLGSFWTMYSNVKDPASKTLTRMLAHLDRVTTQKTGSYLHSMMEVFGMDTSVLSAKKGIYNFSSAAEQMGVPGATWLRRKTNPFGDPLYEAWLTHRDGGVILTTGQRVSGFDDYVKMMKSRSGRKNLKAERRKHIKSLEKQIESKTSTDGKKLTDSEIRILRAEETFLRRTLQTIDDMKKLTDFIHDDAATTGMRLAGKIESAYLPFSIKGDIKQIIYDQQLSVSKKAHALAEMTQDTLDASLKRKDKNYEKVNIELKKLIKKMAESQDKNEKQYADYYNAHKRYLQKFYTGQGEIPHYDVLMAMEQGLFTDGFKLHSKLEKPRRMGQTNTSNVDIQRALLEFQFDMLDKNLITIYTDYFMGAAKRIELARAFTPTGKLFDNLVKMIPEDEAPGGSVAKIFEKLGFEGAASGARKADRPGEVPFLIGTNRHLMQMMKESFTGEDSYTRSHKLSKPLRELMRTEMVTKISLGMAVIPNMFQLLISVYPRLGFTNTFVKPIQNLTSKPVVGRMVKKSGTAFLTLGEELTNESRALQQGGERVTMSGAIARAGNTPTQGFIRQALDTAGWGLKNKRAAFANIWDLFGSTVSTPFVNINVMNKVMAAAGAESFIVKAARTLTDQPRITERLMSLKSDKSRKKYYAEKLRYYFGVDADEVIKHADAIINREYKTKADLKMREKIMVAMERFATETQQGRDFRYDMYLLTDPLTKPAMLFKRFPIRQTGFIFNTVRFEMMHGNILAPITAAAGGLFGGAFSMAGKTWLRQYLSGDEIYYSPEGISRWLESDEDEYTVLGLSPRKLLEVYSYGGLLGMVGETEAVKFGSGEPLKQRDTFFSKAWEEIKPVWWADWERGSAAASSFWLESRKNDTPGRQDRNVNIALRKASRELLPVFGSLLSNWAQPKMYEEWPWAGSVLEINNTQRFKELYGTRNIRDLPREDVQKMLDEGIVKEVPMFPELPALKKERAEWLRGETIKNIKEWMVYAGEGRVEYKIESYQTGSSVYTTSDGKEIVLPTYEDEIYVTGVNFLQNWEKEIPPHERGSYAYMMMSQFNATVGKQYPDLMIDEYEDFSEAKMQDYILLQRDKEIKAYIEDEETKILREEKEMMEKLDREAGIIK